MENKNFDFWTIISWVVIAVLVIWGIYNMGKNSNRQLSPQEQREESENCYKWTGRDCDPYSAD
ncbi:MAG: hypothetical protein WAX44_02775 [Minisyncoccia bacterium]